MFKAFGIFEKTLEEKQKALEKLFKASGIFQKVLKKRPDPLPAAENAFKWRISLFFEVVVNMLNLFFIFVIFWMAFYCSFVTVAY